MNLEVFKIWISFQCLYLIGKSTGFVLGYIGSLEPEVFLIPERTLPVFLCPDYFVSVTLGRTFFNLSMLVLSSFDFHLSRHQKMDSGDTF